MAVRKNAVFLAGAVGLGAYFLMRGTANGNGNGNGATVEQGPAGPACVPCNWPTPIPMGHEECPGCLRSWVVPPPFHFLFPWFHPVPVGAVPGTAGWSLPGPGTAVSAPTLV